MFGGRCKGARVSPKLDAVREWGNSIVGYFVGGTAALLFFMLRQNYEKALFCFIFSESQGDFI